MKTSPALAVKLSSALAAAQNWHSKSCMVEVLAACSSELLPPNHQIMW
jgi:hypothetical protein